MVSFQKVIGTTIGNGYQETYVEKNGEQLKTLATPGIIRSDQPNEVIVEIVNGGNNWIEIDCFTYYIFACFVLFYFHS